jgi:hypothetical protein
MATQLLKLAHAAEQKDSPAMAYEYYRRAESVLPSMPGLREGILNLQSQTKESPTTKVALLFTDSLPQEYRDRIKARLAERLEKQGVALTVDELKEVSDLSSYDFIIEARKFNLQWKVEPSESQNEWSEYLAGYQKVLNPAYVSANREYQAAASRYNQHSYAGGIGNPGDRTAESFNLVARSMALRALREAEMRRQNTTQYLEEPVYKNYQYGKRVFQEKGEISVEVAVVDVLEKQEHGVEEVSVTKDNTEVEIAGSHPKDETGISDHSFSQEASLLQQEQMKAEVFELIAEKLASLLFLAPSFRAEEYLAHGGVREASETTLQFTDDFLSEAKVKERRDYVWSEMLQGGLPSSGKKLIAEAREARTFPPSTLVARLLAPPVPPPVFSTPSHELSTEEIVERAAPSVVTVRTFLGQGSGFLFDPSGLIFTNAHVLKGAKDILVELADGRKLIASVIKVDSRHDIAILQVQGSVFPVLPMRWGKYPAMGEEVVAVGAPGGLQNTVTRGIVSGIRRFGDVFNDINVDPDLKMIQTDAAINPGNSGGPLLDHYGRVVGMNTYKKSGNEGIGFAIAVGNLEEVFHSLNLP